MKAKRIPHTMGLLVQNQKVLGDLTDAEADDINRQPNLFLEMAIEAWRNRKPEVVEYSPKFRLLADLGVLEWREEYDLDWFKKERRSKFHYYNNNLTNKNFSNPSRMPKPGDKFRVQLHEQIVKGNTTSEERLTYLKSLPNTVLLGAHGLPMLYDQKRSDLPKGKWHYSFDEKDHLPFLNGCHRVPGLGAYDVGDFGLFLGRFEGDWRRSDVLVSFSDETQSSES